MSAVFYVIIVLVGIASLSFIIGLILPKERCVTRQSMFDVSPEELFKVVTNNDDWKYRSDLESLNIIDRKGDIEVWEETGKGGNVIRFTTREKVPYSLYSFDMESKMFSGYWTAEFEEADTGKTLFTATEYIRIRNPFIKSLSYLFFDIGKLMETYQTDLGNKLKTRLRE